jgi:hypothetical protein
MEENNIDHWLDDLAGRRTDDGRKEHHLEGELLHGILTREYEHQQSVYRNRAEQDWPDLQARLRREGLLDKTGPAALSIRGIRDWIVVHWKIALPVTGAALTAAVLLLFLLLPRQPDLESVVSDNYTSYPRFRGGAVSRFVLRDRHPARQAAALAAEMEKAHIPFRLDRMPGGFQIEYFLPDTLPDQATDFLTARHIPLKFNTWQILLITEKENP